MKKEITIENHHILSDILGSEDKFLKIISKSFDVKIYAKGNKIIYEDDKEINKVLGSTIETFKIRGNFKLIEMENAGHFANLDNPDLFNRTLEIFLSC